MNFAHSPIDWLLDSLEPAARLFHAGQYCGAWKASTQGLAPASFHLVISGEAWLHHKQETPQRLNEGDALFLLRDQAHWLSSSPDPSLLAHTARQPMQPFSHADAEVGLVCGFFDVGQGPGQWIVSALPDFIILRAQDEGMRQARSIFTLIMEETQRPHEPSSALLQRLSDLLLIYALRYRLQTLEQISGIAGVALSAQFAPLFDKLINQPAAPWSMDDMAAVVGMSRSAFIKHFNEKAGQSPGQVLMAIRMYLASKMLRAGSGVAEAADAVGYQSVAAFIRAFKKYSGQLPGAYKKDGG
ncbi:MAG: AraC family transcriptional regulator [Gammaproteobacteria bacterium HGW-Gammaproteobacteria-11]|nr:MAG: AraC family transcriptional regulator [Gammaproteobacteria bacterium HGW-Gammaproteobacteria-11]